MASLSLVVPRFYHRLLVSKFGHVSSNSVYGDEMLISVTITKVQDISLVVPKFYLRIFVSKFSHVSSECVYEVDVLKNVGNQQMQGMLCGVRKVSPDCLETSLRLALCDFDVSKAGWGTLPSLEI